MSAHRRAELRYGQHHEVTVSTWRRDTDGLGVFAVSTGAGMIHADLTAEQARLLASHLLTLAVEIDAAGDAP